MRERGCRETVRGCREAVVAHRKVIEAVRPEIVSRHVPSHASRFVLDGHCGTGDRTSDLIEDRSNQVPVTRLSVEQ